MGRQEAGALHYSLFTGAGWGTERHQRKVEEDQDLLETQTLFAWPKNSSKWGF